MAKNAAPAKGPGSPSQHESFAANFATTDLTTRALKPAFAPQQVDFTNSGATLQSAVYTMQDGTVMTKPIPPGATYPAEGPIDTITDTSGADVSAVAHWWHGQRMPFNPA
jgi:hypothetical protein